MKRYFLICTLLIGLLFSCIEKKSQKNAHENAEFGTKLIQKNFRRFIEEGWNQKDMVAFREVSVENYIRNLNGINVAKFQNEMEANMNIYFNGFPDATVTVDKISTADNYLFTQWTFSGTNTGVFGDFPATGKKVDVSGYSALQFNKEGKIVSEDVYYNELELLQQLGYTLNPPVLE